MKPTIGETLQPGFSQFLSLSQACPSMISTFLFLRAGSLTFLDPVGFIFAFSTAAAALAVFLAAAFMFFADIDCLTKTF